MSDKDEKLVIIVGGTFDRNREKLLKAIKEMAEKTPGAIQVVKELNPAEGGKLVNMAAPRQAFVLPDLSPPGFIGGLPGRYQSNAS